MMSGLGASGLVLNTADERKIRGRGAGRRERQDLFIKVYCLGIKSKFLSAANKTLVIWP